SWLWNHWFSGLRKLDGAKAQKIFDKSVKHLKVWDADFSEESRVKCLVRALAYTRIVVRSEKEKP
ncbi:MAG TPA: hypothetical protein VGF13_15820, partial [Verrucomicrobiae bacterium]